MRYARLLPLGLLALAAVLVTPEGGAPGTGVAPVSAVEDFIVAVGEDKIFTEFNYHDAWFEDDPGNPEPWPDAREAYSQASMARVSLSATPGHAGVAQAQVGVQFEWDLGPHTWEEVRDWPVTVTVDFSYQIEAHWIDGYGSANATVSVAGFSGGYDQIGFEVGEKGSRSNTVTEEYESTVEELEGLARLMTLDVYGQVHLTIDGTVPHHSLSEAQISSIKIDFPEPAVLLVHGWNSNCRAFNQLKPWLEARLGAGRVECFGYQSESGVKVGANRLRDRVADFKDQMKPITNGKIDIVAHSMGGLVSRYYVEELGGSADVQSLTMLGTPNLGTFLADDYVLLDRVDFTINDYGAFDMQTASKDEGSLLYSLNNGFVQPAGVVYKAVAGNWPNGFFDWYFGIPHDCVVTVFSVKGPFPFPGITNERPVAHPGFCVLSTPRLLGDSSSDCDTNPNHVFCDVLAVLNQSGPAAPLAGLGIAVAGPPDPDARLPTVATLAGTALPSSTLAETVYLDPSIGSVGFVLAWGGTEDSVALRITRPDATVVQTSDADVTYVPATAVVSGNVLEAYQIDTPAAGNWQLAVEGVNAPPAGEPFSAVVYGDTPISLAVSATPSTVTVGAGIVMDAVITDTGAGLPGASATATIVSPSNISTPLAMIDQGGGSYSVTSAPLDECGIYFVHVQVSGTASVGAFAREGQLVIDARAAGDEIGDPCLTDDDSDAYSDLAELALGTDPFVSCALTPAADDEADDRWPPDFDDNQVINTVDVFQVLPPYYGTTVPPTSARRDLVPDGVINTTDVFRVLPPFLGGSCTP